MFRCFCNQKVLLNLLGEAEQIDWRRASLDAGSVPAPWSQKTDLNPTDRGKKGLKRHLVVEGKGIPLAVIYILDLGYALIFWRHIPVMLVAFSLQSS